MDNYLQKYNQAVRLRKKGFSLLEIARKLKIAKSTASVWSKDVEISQVGIERLANRRILGRIKSENTKRKRRKSIELLIKDRSKELLKNTVITGDHKKILCALLYMCEGTKDIRGGIHFVNSNLSLVKTFLSLLRSAFDLDEKKFRVCIHLHEYHDVKEQIKYWSRATSIPESQFVKPYLKPHTSKRIKENYPGCVNISYYGSVFAKELMSIAEEALKTYK